MIGTRSDRKRTMPRLRYAALAVAALCAVGAPSATAQQTMVVGVDTVRSEPLRQTVPVIGRLVARQSGVVAARIRGPIGVFQVEVGERVERDEIVAVLDINRLSAERDLRAAAVTEAAAAVVTARAEIKLKKQELTRIEGLRASAAFSQGRYDDARQEVSIAEGELGEAEAALGRARAQLRLAEIDLAYAEVRAPYAGVVSQRHMEVGSWVDIGDPVITLVDDRHLEIEVDVPAERIGGLAPGTRVTVEIPGVEADEAGKALTATVRAVVPDENPLTRTRTVRFVPEFDSDGGLAANQSATVHLPAGTPRTVVSVHKDAVINRRGKTLVFLVIDGAAQIRPVSLGEAVGGRFEVLGGLKPGDIAVVRGNERLRPGQKVATREGTRG